MHAGLRRIAPILSVAICLFGTESGAAEIDPAVGPWPRLYSGQDNTACKDVLAVAKLAFLSPAERIFEAAPYIPITDTRIILAPNEHSSGFLIDSGYVETQTAGPGTVFFHKYAGDWRFVVTEMPFNSNGDIHGLYLISGAVKPEEIADVFAHPPDASISDIKKIFSGQFQRPWLLFTNLHILAIDTKRPSEFLADWLVYDGADKGAEQALCHIGFRPDVQDSVQLLPPGPLQDLAKLADEIVGTPQNDGTLNPSGTIRARVHNMWANLMLRPWAVQEPYNSPKEVEEALLRWSQGREAYREQYERLNTLYPQALEVLTQYYRTSQNMSASDAAALAKPSLERALGTHFVFAKTNK